MSTYFCLLTAIGQASIANAVALNQDVQLAEMAVGDGDGTPITPLATMTTLVNEVYRIPANTIYVDSQDAGHVVTEMVIPNNQGGWTVREIGLFDVNGDLFAVGSLPESVKPATGEGAGAEMTLRMHLSMSAAQAETVEIKIDPTVVLSTRQHVTTKIVEHDEDVAAHGNLGPGLVNHIADNEAHGGPHAAENHTHSSIETDYISGASMTPASTNGAAVEIVETTTNKQDFAVMVFAGDADSVAEFSFPMPENWDRGDIKAKIFWSPEVGSSIGDDVSFDLQAVALSEGDALDVAFAGAGVAIADQVLGEGESYLSPASAALTIEGNPAPADLIQFRLARDVSEGPTPMSVGCRVLGIWIQYTCNQAVTAW